MKDIIGIDINSFVKWLELTKKFFCKEGEKLCIEHLISNSKFDLTKEEDIYLFIYLFIYEQRSNKKKTRKKKKDNSSDSKLTAH